MTNKPCFMLYLVSVEQLYTHNLYTQIKSNAMIHSIKLNQRSSILNT